ncbi:MAG: type IX secretion system membrane protein PorP/SprF [Bacteroidales bacterium]|nr:type IX secretion system membrane protein PorP/SprF [Bacteroidales bacterium]
MMKKISLLIVLFVTSILSFGQQKYQFTQYMFDKLAFNPGFAGTKNAICVSGILRQQWVGFRDTEGNKVAPETFNIAASSPLKFLHGGIGLILNNEKIGFFNDVELALAYSYHYDLGGGTLGMGIQLNFLNKSLDFSKLKPIQENDPILTDKGDESDMIIDFGFGAYYHVPGKYYIGLASVPITQPSAQGTAFKVKRSFNLMAGYEYTIPSHPQFEINPSIMIQSEGGTMQYNISALLLYNKKFWGGVNYRLEDAIGIILGMTYKNFKIGYSYDVVISAIKQGGGGGTHEVMFGYCFSLEFDKGVRKYKNTRFL